MKTIKSVILAGLLSSFSIISLYAQDKDVQKDYYKEVTELDAQRNKELETARVEMNNEMDATMRGAIEEKKPEMFADKRGIIEQNYNEKVKKIEKNYVERRTSILNKYLVMNNIDQQKLNETEQELAKLDIEYFSELSKFMKENEREILQAREEYMKEGKEDKYREKVKSLENKYFEKAMESESKYYEKRDKIFTTHFGEIQKHNDAKQKNDLDTGNK